jgi:hypothetical protein
MARLPMSVEPLRVTANDSAERIAQRLEDIKDCTHISTWKTVLLGNGKTIICSKGDSPPNMMFSA